MYLTVLMFAALRAFSQHASHMADQVVALLMLTPTSRNHCTARQVLRYMELPSEAYASVFAHRRIRGEDYAKCEGEFDIDHEVWSMWELEREADEWKGHGSPSTSAGEWEERWLKQRAWAKHARDYDAELLDY